MAVGTRRLAPWWLSLPSRAGGLASGRARLALAALALLLVAALLPVAADAWDGASDLPAGLVDGVRHGGSFYAIAADAARSSGEPLAPLAVPSPALAVATGRLSPIIAALLLDLLALGTAIAWYPRVMAALRPGGARWVGTALIGLGLAGAIRADAALPSVWSGLLAALALAWWRPAHRPGRWVEPAALGLAAMLVAPAAAGWGIVMAAFALAEHRRREAAGWAGAVGVAVAAFLLHAHALAGLRGDADVAGYVPGLLGTGFAAQALAAGTGLFAMPPAIGGALAALALAGWAGRRDALAARVAAGIGGVALLLATLARPGAQGLAMLAAPVLLPGLAFVPDLIRDLVAAALDTRRLTVTRVKR